MFGVENAVFNFHLVYHLEEMYNTHGPLYKTSAYGAESCYGFLSRNSAPTSRNLPKTWMKIGYGRLANHRCRAGKSNRNVSHKDRPSVDDSLVWTLGFTFYKVLDKVDDEDDDVFICARLICQDIVGRIEGLNLDFTYTEFGVKQWTGEQHDDYVLLMGDDIRGKAVLCDRADGMKWLLAAPVGVVCGEY